MKKKLSLALLIAIFLMPSYSSATLVFETTSFVIGTETQNYSFAADQAPYTYQAIFSDLSVSPFFGFDSASLTIQSTSDILGSITGFGNVTFDVSPGESLFANIFATGGGTTQTGLYGLQISTVDSPVPEPTTIVLFGLGLGLLGLAGSNKKKNRNKN